MDLLSSLYHQITLKDLIDILIVTFLIYQILIIFHGTRAVQMLLGLGAMIVLSWIGNTFKLYSVMWILDHFFESFFIIAVIVFQDQLRNTLARFGTGRNFLGVLRKEQASKEIEEVVSAVDRLAKRKIGALIVFERSQGLANFAATGTRLDALIHTDLLFSLFQTNSPLHDGAVIINQGLINAVGCFLPLTRHQDLDRSMGTRHRAALGVSEGTDAVAIVVSEETGKIKMAVDGVFYQCDNGKQLRQYLKHLLASERLDESLVPIKTRMEGS